MTSNKAEPSALIQPNKIEDCRIVSAVKCAENGHWIIQADVSTVEQTVELKYFISEVACIPADQIRILPAGRFRPLDENTPKDEEIWLHVRRADDSLATGDFVLCRYSDEIGKNGHWEPVDNSLAEIGDSDIVSWLVKSDLEG